MPNVLTLDQLNRINRDISKRVPLVNFGGCAFYATLIQRRLSELGHATQSGVIAYTPPDGADHVFTVVTINGEEYFHDGDETTILSNWLSNWQHFRTEFLPWNETINVVNTNRWNTMFRPIREVPILCEIIEKRLGPFNQRPHFDTIQGVKI